MAYDTERKQLLIFGGQLGEKFFKGTFKLAK
jgi:hypothetical protein